MSYRIKTVAELTGIPRGTLLAWERRYAVPEPGREASGYRLYDDGDVALLTRLKGLVDAGHPIGEAVGIVRSTTAAATTAPTGDVVGRLVAGLLAFDRESVDKVATELRPWTFEQALDQAYLPVLSRVGDLWAAGEATIAQEHFASGWCREQMLSMFHVLGSGPVHGPTVACAMPPHDQHELGLLAVAVKLALRGWRVTWLGSQLPVADLCAYVTVERPKLLCLSAVLGPSPQAAEAYALQVRAGCGPQTTVACGGPGAATLEARSTEDLWFTPTWEALRARLGAAP